METVVKMDILNPFNLNLTGVQLVQSNGDRTEHSQYILYVTPVSMSRLFVLLSIVWGQKVHPGHPTSYWYKLDKVATLLCLILRLHLPQSRTNLICQWVLTFL